MLRALFCCVAFLSALSGAVNPSGKPWLSGYTTDKGSWADFAKFRGASQDIAGTWHCTQDWGYIEAGGCRNYMGPKADAGLDGPLNHGWAKTKPQWHGVGLLPEDKKSNLKACANGDYDSHFTALGNSIVSAGMNLPNVFLRLGWEGNGYWYPWGVAAHPDDFFKNNAQRTAANYVGCFKKAVTAIRKKATKVKISWNPNKDGGADELAMYPGDTYVDIVDVDYYNDNPLAKTLTDFNNQVNSKYSGDTIGRGLKGWLDFAVKHKKKLAVSEWAANAGDYAGYIEGMHAFFKANAAKIAWESYYNQLNDGFRVYNPSVKPNPKSAAKYAALWKKTATRSVRNETAPADDDHDFSDDYEVDDDDYVFDPSILDLPADYYDDTNSTSSDETVHYTSEDAKADGLQDSTEFIPPSNLAQPQTPSATTDGASAGACVVFSAISLFVAAIVALF